MSYRHNKNKKSLNGSFYFLLHAYICIIDTFTIHINLLASILTIGLRSKPINMIVIIPSLSCLKKYLDPINQVSY